MWLQGHLATAQRGRDQLDRKLRILIPELQRRRLAAQRWQQEWASACTEADIWLLRATLLGGQDALRAASTTELTHITVTWTTAMGLSYPADAQVTEPSERPSERPSESAMTPVASPTDNAAIPPATSAFRTALLAGIRTAAADEAVRRVEAEIALTRRRLRALEKRWLPLLQDALAQLELSLEQAEQEDGMRLRRATATRPDRRTEP
jgi:V/A-type H+-transporting ATPase subunit D